MWGTCKRRHGGGASRVCEFTKYMNIVEFLDPVSPRVSRLSDKYIRPYFFPGLDHTKPNRGQSERLVKKYQMFNVKITTAE